MFLKDRPKEFNVPNNKGQELSRDRLDGPGTVNSEIFHSPIDWSRIPWSKFSHNPVYWETMQDIRTVKGIVLGNGGVGKTCLLKHYKDRGYTDHYGPTNGLEFIAKDYPHQLRFQIWDCPGDDRFLKIAASYFKGVHVFLLVFDVTNRGSFESLQFLEKYIEKEGKPYRTVLMIGNKNDLGKRAVTREEAENYAHNKGYAYMETSCKTQTSQQIQQKFDELLYSHIMLALPINNFSDDNFTRSLSDNLIMQILAKARKEDLPPLKLPRAK